MHKIFLLQQALRLIAYRDIHKVLGMDKLADSSPGGRKRPNESGSDTGNKMIKQEVTKK